MSAALDLAGACRIAGCPLSVHVKVRGLCRPHYLRWHKYGDPLAGATATNATVDWILAHVAHKGEACLIWPFSTIKGYGQTWREGKPALASRVMCTLAHGEPPTPYHHAAHSCGKGAQGCVHPDHLSWKTPIENEFDKIEHGTSNRGERHGMAKLTLAEVAIIRTTAGLLSQREIASQFGVSQQTISKIIRGDLWPEEGVAHGY